MAELLSAAEHEGMRLTADLWNLFVNEIVDDGESRSQDLGEIRVHIHEIQRAIMSQAACRAYPDQYRLLGGKPFRG